MEKYSLKELIDIFHVDFNNGGNNPIINWNNIDDNTMMRVFSKLSYKDKCKIYEKALYLMDNYSGRNQSESIIFAMYGTPDNYKSS